jgi:hypothetical protein
VPLLLPHDVAAEVKALCSAIVENDLELRVVVRDGGVASIAGLLDPRPCPRLGDRRGSKQTRFQSLPDDRSNACAPLGI